MGAKLLVRTYNVGCGDCIYVRIPHGADGFHILIDCGSKESAASRVVPGAVRHLIKNMLPPAGAKKRLDLLVATHRHEDHIKGFDPELFERVAIRNIWLSAAMDELHPDAEGTRKLHSVAKREMATLAQAKDALHPDLHPLVDLYAINNRGATTALTKTLPDANGIKPHYVFAGQTASDLGVSIDDTEIHVLAPEYEIDHFYLGKEVSHRLRGLRETAVQSRESSEPETAAPPPNIAAADFRTLRSRLLSNGLAFAVDDSKIQNNVSVVLLIVWKKKRLLFVGDAEWEDEYRPGKRNSSWNVMWHKRRQLLAKRLDFLKIGHHGSRNATPWNRDADAGHEVNQILEAILPLPAEGEEPRARCVVSTKRKQYDTIPDAELLTELAKRVRDTKTYLEDFVREDPDFDPAAGIFNYSVLKEYKDCPKPQEVGEKGYLDRPQPPRTDMESAGRGREEMSREVEFVDVEL